MIEKIRNGAFWVSLISLLSLPFAYYRSWILNQIDSTGELLGLFALILVFIELAITMSVFGGASSLSNYLPKIENKNERSKFIKSFYLLTIVLTLFFVVFLLNENIVDFLSLSEIYENNKRELTLLVFFLVTSQIGIYCLNGFFYFKLSSFLSNTQVVFVCLFLTLTYFFNVNVEKQEFLKQIIYLLIFVYLIIFIISVLKLRHENKIYFFHKGFYFPEGFLKFSIYIHGNTICTMIYLTADRIILASKFGLSVLAMYYVFSQISEIIRFIPNKIGQVLLASFSKIEGSLSDNELKDSYQEVIENIVFISSLITISIVVFSYQIAGIFNYSSKDEILVLNLLATFTCIGSIGPVNAMLIMSKEKTVDYFFNSLLQISVQLFFTLMTIESLGIMSVVIGKCLGIVSAQLGLIYILKYRLNLNFVSLPISYYICQINCLLVVFYMYNFGSNLVYSFCIFLLFMIITFFFNRKALNNIGKILRNRIEA